MLKTKRKYTYLRVLQQRTSCGWEDVDCFDLHNSTVKERRQSLRVYQENQPEYSYRWVNRRELNN